MDFIFTVVFNNIAVAFDYMNEIAGDAHYTNLLRKSMSKKLRSIWKANIEKGLQKILFYNVVKKRFKPKNFVLYRRQI